MWRVECRERRRYFDKIDLDFVAKITPHIKALSAGIPLPLEKFPLIKWTSKSLSHLGTSIHPYPEQHIKRLTPSFFGCIGAEFVTVFMINHDFNVKGNQNYRRRILESNTCSIVEMIQHWHNLKRPPAKV